MKQFYLALNLLFGDLMVNELLQKGRKRYFVIMLFCFLYGGFLLLNFFSQVYSFFWVAEFLGPSNDVNFFDTNNDDLNRHRGVDQFGPQNRVSKDPIVFFISPTNISNLVGGIISFVAAISIFFLIREKDIKEIKHKAASNLLLPEEKKIIDLLKKLNYESTQSKLVKESGLSKVQVHRVIKKLESKGLLEKHNYGLTNKIILKKEIFE